MGRNYVGIENKKSNLISAGAADLINKEREMETEYGRNKEVGTLS